MSGQEISENSVVWVIPGKKMEGLPFFFPAVVTEVLSDNTFLVRTDRDAREIKVSADMLVKIGELEDFGMSASDFLDKNKTRAMAALALEIHNLRRQIRKEAARPV